LNADEDDDDDGMEKLEENAELYPPNG